eukprot:35182-Karenia_brevis.AAC.1
MMTIIMTIIAIIITIVIIIIITIIIILLPQEDLKGAVHKWQQGWHHEECTVFAQKTEMDEKQ